jgi:lipopolysaccharide transport system permease protein
LSDSTPPVTVIEPPRGWQVINFKELVAYRDLFWFLTHKAIRTRYAQSALGIVWAVIQPVATMLVFTLIFGKMVQVESDGVPYFIFSFTALVPWTYFQNALTEAVASLIAQQNMLSKIYFPRLVLPISVVLARLLDLVISFALLIAIIAWYWAEPGWGPNWGVVFLPVFIVMMIFSATGLGLFLSAMAVQYRDINYGMSFLVRLLMYAAPVVYPANLVPDQYRIYYGLNPMVGVIEGFRSALLGTNPMPWDLILPGLVASVIMLVVGALYFRRKERVFADVA